MDDRILKWVFDIKIAIYEIDDFVFENKKTREYRK